MNELSSASYLDGDSNRHTAVALYLYHLKHDHQQFVWYLSSERLMNKVNRMLQEAPNSVNGTWKACLKTGVVVTGVRTLTSKRAIDLMANAQNIGARLCVLSQGGRAFHPHSWHHKSRNKENPDTDAGADLMEELPLAVQAHIKQYTMGVKVDIVYGFDKNMERANRLRTVAFSSGDSRAAYIMYGEPMTRGEYEEVRKKGYLA